MRQNSKDKLSSVFDLDGRTGPYDLKQLFPEGRKVFSNPEACASDWKGFCHLLRDANDLCIDLFAGSATLAQAVMELARREGSRRRFISIQYPEPNRRKTAKMQKKLTEFCMKAGIKPFISEISKERIRRAGHRGCCRYANPLTGTAMLAFAS